MIIPDHWLVRGAQSAVFYYISCGPCLTISYQRRRRKEAARDRKQKDLELRLRPELYAHPGPAEMNEHWREDMELGPFPPRKRPRKGTKDSAAKAAVSHINTAELDYMIGKAGHHDPSVPPIGNIGSRRYQRADEEIQWKSSEQEPNIRIPTSIDYCTIKAPPINDLHPAVVSILPLEPEDRKWMKALPPSTDFLHGTKGVTFIGGNASWRASVASSNQEHEKHNASLSHQSPLAPAPVLRTGSRKMKKLEKDQQTIALSRPDSAVSTCGRTRNRAGSSRLHHESSTASSDADDDDDNHHVVIARPKAIYRVNSQPARQSSIRRRAGIADHDFGISSAKTSTTTPPQTSPTLLSQSTNSENLSPRISPRSGASLASPLSSDEEGLPLPRIRSVRTNAQDDTATARMPSSMATTKHKRQSTRIEKQTALRPFTLAKPDTLLTENVKSSADMEQQLVEATAGLGLHDSNGSVDLSSAAIDHQTMLQWQQLSENAAKEQMWLGPRPLKSSVGTPEKRHSVDF